MTGERRGGPGDTLIVSGGGITLVATDTLLTEAARLRVLQAEAEDWLDRLARIQSLDSDPATGPAWGAEPAAGASVYATRHALSTVLERSGTLADALLAAAEGYGRADRMVGWGTRLSGAWLGSTMGLLAPILALAAVPALTAGAVGLLLGLLVTGTRIQDPAAMTAAWLQVHPRALTNPFLVAAVRVLVSSVDDAAAGRAGVPFPVSLALGDQGAGVFGVTTTAGVVVVLARSLGLLRETPVAVERLDSPTRPLGPPHPQAAPGPPVPGAAAPGAGAHTRPVAPPTGFGDLAARIPSVSANAAQVRIEHYGGTDDASWIVYIGGTAAWSPVTGEQPWDLTSNLAAVADQGAGSYRAVVQALHEAGVAPGDPVVTVGHSQGGLVAAELAASDEFNTVMVATFGAPGGQVTLPTEVSAVTVEHSDDLIPAVGGAASAVDGRLIVRREAFLDRIPPPDQVLPAHALTEYRDTGYLMDGSEEPRLRQFRDTLKGVTGTDAGAASRWRGIRLLGGSAGGALTNGG
ncbi:MULTISPECIES: alpha/beta hydrolase [Cryobacterium]|uniref:DUF1023 domain-containing protein n=1 Tax=Cryobacterium breve TaxID=1259258 RepID=A0ABY2IUE1_9MICO|nr:MULTISPECIES: alpha/beta hydrolase [Cryobacterium]TFC94850.1 hypothetical protein E3O65_16380 [Cryobacterium breve]TFC94980.1 hypothetical protein E3T20_06990 [Cryobacterium sp. TmT3-12]